MACSTTQPVAALDQALPSHYYSSPITKMSVVHKIEKQSSKLKSLPPGFHFQPSEEELVGYFLSAQLLEIASLGVKFPVVDVAGKGPSDLTGLFGEDLPEDIYLFSKVPTSWKTATGSWRKVRSSPLSKENGTLSNLPAVKTSYVFEGKGSKGEWVMHELRFSDKNPMSFPADFAVFHVCKSKSKRFSKVPKSCPRPCKLAPNWSISRTFQNATPAESSSDSSSSSDNLLKRPPLCDDSSSSFSDTSDYGKNLNKKARRN